MEKTKLIWPSKYIEWKLISTWKSQHRKSAKLLSNYGEVNRFFQSSLHIFVWSSDQIFVVFFFACANVFKRNEGYSSEFLRAMASQDTAL